MNPKIFSKTLIKIHLAFYDTPLKIDKESKDEVVLKIDDEYFSIENHIKTRYRITFPDYVGKIGRYRNLFGHIMGNSDNVCDTSDFIDLPVSHIIKIYNDIENLEVSALKKIKIL